MSISVVELNRVYGEMLCGWVGSGPGIRMLWGTGPWDDFLWSPIDTWCWPRVEDGDVGTETGLYCIACGGSGHPYEGYAEDECGLCCLCGGSGDTENCLPEKGTACKDAYAGTASNPAGTE